MPPKEEPVDTSPVKQDPLRAYAIMNQRIDMIEKMNAMNREFGTNYTDPQTFMVDFNSTWNQLITDTNMRKIYADEQKQHEEIERNHRSRQFI